MDVLRSMLYNYVHVVMPVAWVLIITDNGSFLTCDRYYKCRSFDILTHDMCKPIYQEQWRAGAQTRPAEPAAPLVRIWLYKKCP